MESKQLLREQNIEPSTEIIAAGLGTVNKQYLKFVGQLKKFDITLMDWRYYNDGKAWLSKGEYKWTTPRGVNKVKPIFWLSIWEGFFKVSFYFAAASRVELQALPISEDIKEIIVTAKPMGKTMRFFPLVIDVKNEKQLADVYEISKFRKSQ